MYSCKLIRHRTHWRANVTEPKLAASRMCDVYIGAVRTSFATHGVYPIYVSVPFLLT